MPYGVIDILEHLSSKTPDASAPAILGPFEAVLVPDLDAPADGGVATAQRLCDDLSRYAVGRDRHR